MSKLDAVFTDAVLDECTQNIVELNSMLTENAAQAAYNQVIFESAMDYVTEAEDEKEFKNGKVGNALYKALDTLKRVFKTVFDKIRAAINAFIAKINANSAAKWIKNYSKEKNYDWGAAYVTPKKYLAIKNPDQVFLLDQGVGELVALGDEEKVAKKLVANIKVPTSNYSKAKEALSKATTIAEVNKVLLSFTSYADDYNDKPMDLATILEAIPDAGKTFAEMKSSYKSAINKINTGIKNTYSEIQNASTQEEKDAIKKEISLAEKLMSFYYAAYVGYMKYYTAMNSATIANIKAAKKGGVEVEESATFMGLALL